MIRLDRTDDDEGGACAATGVPERFRAVYGDEHDRDHRCQGCDGFRRLSRGSAALSACLGEKSSLDAPEGAADPASLPDRQHPWNVTLPDDDDGNVRPPEHHVFLGLSLSSDPDDAAREAVAAALADVERAIERSADGVLFTLGYTPAYFDRFEASLDDAVDLPEPDPIVALTVESQVTVDTDDALLHLASDDGAAILAVEEALFGERDRLNGRSLSATLDSVFERSTRRTGFVGPGMPADRQEGLDGIPDGEPVPEEAPFFMGFRSGVRENQATEDRVTIREGPFAGGATQHFETIVLDLDVWFEDNDHPHRVARMFSPAHAEREAVGEYGEKLGTATGVAGVVDGIYDHAREDGEPLLLRRDVNTTDGDVAGVHFVSLQRSVDEFRRAREAMLGEEFGQYGLGPRQSNGILQYLRVRRWGSYLVPPRTHRALPAPAPDGNA
jgi:hypothetical protein